MRWTSEELRKHATAAKRLTAIKDRAFAYLAAHPRASEYKVEQFVQGEFKRNNLAAEKPFHTQIVGFNAHAAIPHYFPSKRGSARLTPNTLVLLDTWGRLKKPRSPYADITWIAYYGGKVPRQIQKVFGIVRKARDACLTHLRRKLTQGEMPTGAEMDGIARGIIAKAGYGKKFLHNTGHCIGFTSPHGKGMNLSRKFRRPLERNVGYTIEPGIYLKSKFGIRSEINFYITSQNKVIVTTLPQKRIVRI
ncbi:MAG: aminopeptidase P family protein [Candidatus Liptonbacteria bacterium]|nr:aminopeptidase P family protein [Candidatus Liptonbacteria bacterium]